MSLASSLIVFRIPNQGKLVQFKMDILQREKQDREVALLFETVIKTIFAAHCTTRCSDITDTRNKQEKQEAMMLDLI